eukprot:gene1616-5915_t
MAAQQDEGVWGYLLLSEAVEGGEETQPPVEVRIRAVGPEGAAEAAGGREEAEADVREAEQAAPGARRPRSPPGQSSRDAWPWVEVLRPAELPGAVVCVDVTLPPDHRQELVVAWSRLRAPDGMGAHGGASGAPPQWLREGCCFQCDPHVGDGRGSVPRVPSRVPAAVPGPARAAGRGEQATDPAPPPPGRMHIRAERRGHGEEAGQGRQEAGLVWGPEPLGGPAGEGVEARVAKHLEAWGMPGARRLTDEEAR